MQQIREQTTQAGYIAAATLEGVWNSPGGYYSVEAGGALMELQYAPPGQGTGGLTWTNEVFVPVGNGNLTAGTTGVRFRDAGSTTGPAIVTAALSAEAEPLIVVGAPGSLVLAAGGTINGQINSDGSVAAGATVVSIVKGGNGIYTATFATAFSATPTIVLSTVGVPTGINLTTASPTGFAVRSFVTSSNVASDSAWTFFAAPASA